MKKAVIRKNINSPTQSGSKSGGNWILEFERDFVRNKDNLMGWVGSSGAGGRSVLEFPSRESAESYAQSCDIQYEVIIFKKRSLVKKSYDDNFKRRN